MAIKKLPEDFQVDEVLDPLFEAGVSPEPKRFALYRLDKKSLSTPEAMSLFLKHLRLPRHAGAYAGLKDKHGQTSQSVTVELPPKASPQRIITDRNWSARLQGYVPEAISSKAIQANRFRLTLRTLTRRDMDSIHDRARQLTIPGSSPPSLLVVNYFGDQRFGSARAGEFTAPALMRGEFEAVLRHMLAEPHRKDATALKRFKRLASEHWGDWRGAWIRELPRVPEKAAIEHLQRKAGDYRGAFSQLPYLSQQMSVEAYQSLLWNCIAREFVTRELGPADELMLTKDMFGDMLFPAASRVPAGLRGLDLPILGCGDELLEPWKAAAQAVLKVEGITTADLRIPGLRRPWFGSAPRSLFVTASELHIANPQPDELQDKARRFKLVVCFTLPRGSYATVALRALGQ